MNLRLGCILVLVVLILPPAIAARYLSASGVFLVVVVEVLLLTIVGPKVGGWLVRRFIMNLFTMKSRVLRGAKAEVHDVRRTARPADADRFVEPDDASPLAPTDGEPPESIESDVLPARPAAEDDPTEADRVYWQVEFTLRPKAGASKMQFVDLDDLMLVPFDARVSLDADPTEDVRAGSVHQTFVEENGIWRVPEGKVPGVEQRLRVIFRCPPTLRGRVKFRYYFEGFGDFALPG